MAQTLYASFIDAAMAEKAAGALLDHGVRAEDISVVANEAHAGAGAEGASQDADTLTTDAPAGPDDMDVAARTGISTTTRADAGIAAAEGAGIGLALGILGGIASMVVPGMGLVLGGGALATAVAAALGTAAGGAITGGVIGYLKDMGVPDVPAIDYQSAVEHGGALLAVHVPSGPADEATIQDLLEKYGAANVNTYPSTSPEAATIRL